MKVTVDITEGITLRIAPQPKKNSKNPMVYDIYLLFTIMENGVTPFVPPAISTGKSVSVLEWDLKQKQMKGRKGELFNTLLLEDINRAKLHLEKFRVEQDVRSCRQVRDEVQKSIRPSITGQAPRGRKIELTSRLKQHTVDSVMERLFEDRQQGEGRQRIYRRAVQLFHQYFNWDTPLITNITEDDLINFKTWFITQFKTRFGTPPAQDTQATWLNMIASIFLHAHKRMKILKEYPLPEGFRVAWKEHEKPVMDEQECMQIFNYPDSMLTRSQQIAKYSLMLQTTTGMGYGDTVSLRHEHLKWDSRGNGWMLNKARNKTKDFKIFLTSRAKSALDKLREISGGTQHLFKLPTTTNGINKNYENLYKKAGVKTHVTTYTLRHTFAVDYMDNDGRLEDLAKMLGNDVSTAAKYGKISNKRLATRAKQLEQKSKMHQL
jgi:integrase